MVTWGCSVKVLIVDDSPVIRQLLIRMLKPYGFIFTEAVNGVEAVAKFADALRNSDKFDLVLMDIEMPEMDGQQALKEIRILEKNSYGVTLNMGDFVRIIMLTSLDDPSHFIEAYTKGKCNGYLTKPVVLDELLEKLKKNHLIDQTWRFLTR